MSQQYPSCPVLVRSVRRALVVSCSGLALTAAGASAATEGGAEAGDPSAAEQRSADPAPATTPVAAPSAPSRAVIRSVQRRLRVEVDGVYGPRTRAAVRRFQRRNGLQADGRLGPETLAELGVEARAASVPSTPPSPETMQLLEAIAQCESGGDPTKVSPGGKHRGKYQFLVSTWEAEGGIGDPAEAPEAEQDQRAASLLASEGAKPWPVCGKKAQALVAAS